MTMKLGVVMDPIENINYVKDTTLGLLLAASERGYSLFYMQQSDLFLDDGQPKALSKTLQVHANLDHWFDLGETQTINLDDLDVILMRKDPPFDNEFIYSTYILEAAEAKGTLIVNRPQSLRDCNEKVFATQFPQCCPPVLVSRNSDILRNFHQQHGDVIFKPLDGMGGAGIFRCKANDPNLGVILETLTDFGQQQIMAQRFIPEISNGDKRILVIDGEAVPYALARVPAEGETRGNLAAGGSGIPQPLTEKDHWIVEQVAPTLKEKGLIFVGLDVIGDYLTEINVTSPTCVREISRDSDQDIAMMLMDAIEKRLQA